MLSDRPQDVSNHIEEDAGSPEKSQKRLNVDEKKRPNIKVKGRDLSHDVQARSRAAPNVTTFSKWRERSSMLSVSSFFRIARLPRIWLTQWNT